MSSELPVVVPDDPPPVSSAHIEFVRTTFKLSQRELANAISVAPYTVSRWEAGANPQGLQAEVLEALFKIAKQVTDKRDDTDIKIMRGLILMGVGALLVYLLSRRS